MNVRTRQKPTLARLPVFIPLLGPMSRIDEDACPEAL